MTVSSPIQAVPQLLPRTNYEVHCFPYLGFLSCLVHPSVIHVPCSGPRGIPRNCPCATNDVLIAVYSPTTNLDRRPGPNKFFSSIVDWKNENRKFDESDEFQL